MRILLANSTCKVGGVSSFMLSLRAGLETAGHQCDLFFFNRGSMEPHLPANGVHFGTLSDCLRLVERTRVDVVHANNIDWTSGISAVRRIGARLVLTAHKVRERDRTYGWTAANCDALTVVSHGLKAILQPSTDAPVQVVYNGVDTSVFIPPGGGPGAGPPIVAWVGRGGSPLKRLDTFAAIAPALRRAGCRIWVFDQHAPETTAAYLPDALTTLRPLCEFWGAVSFAEMPGRYASIAASGGVVVSTSSREGLGLSLLEAQACGCPVIGSNVCGVNESVTPEHGGVLYPFDIGPEVLAQLVIDTCTSGDAPARGRLAAEFVRRNFSRQQMVEQYLAIYQGTQPPRAGAFGTQLRRRLRLSPFVNWPQYVEHRWSVGHTQYIVSQELAGRHEWRLAAAVGWESLHTSPTIYLNPQRLLDLIRTQTRAIGQLVNSARTAS